MQECRNCQLKKLVRIKVRQPIVLTDTANSKDTALVKYQWISWELSTTESGHSYILTIKDLLTKFSVAVPLKQAMSAEIAEALVEKFINPYTAPKVWITDQGPNSISSIIRHTVHKYKISTYQISTCYVTLYPPPST